MKVGYRRWRSRIMVGLLVVATILSVLPLFLILGTVIVKGAGSINLDFFIRRPVPAGEAFGIDASSCGTTSMTKVRWRRSPVSVITTSARSV